MELLALLVIAFIILSYFYATRKFNYWKQLGVQFEKPIPYIGNASLILFKHSMGTYLRELYEKFDSPLIGFFQFDMPLLVVKDPKIIKAILVEDFQYFQNRNVATNLKDDPVGCRMLSLLKNPRWKQIRPKLTGIFTSSKLKLMFPLMVEAASDMLKYAERNSDVPIDAKDFSVRFATDVIVSCAFGVNARSFEDEDSDFRFITSNVFKLTVLRYIQTSCYFLSPFLVKLFKMKFLEPQCGRLMQDILWKVMEERRKTNTKRNDMVDILIEIQDEEHNLHAKFDGDIVAAQAIQFFLGGFETSGSTASFALYELALNRDVQTRLRKEIYSALRSNKGITYEAVQHMKYLDMVVHETLRKYPSVNFLDRNTISDYRVPESNVTIEKGIAVFVPVMGLHYDPSYFPEPDKFDPERFTPENKAIRPSFTYLPFGEGPRGCIGERFGLLTVKLLLVNILSEYEVLSTPETPTRIEIDPRGFILLSTVPVLLKFVRIQPRQK